MKTYIVLLGLCLTFIGVYSQNASHNYSLRRNNTIIDKIAIEDVNPIDFKFNKNGLVYKTNITIDRKNISSRYLIDNFPSNYSNHEGVIIYKWQIEKSKNVHLISTRGNEISGALRFRNQISFKIRFNANNISDEGILKIKMGRHLFLNLKIHLNPSGIVEIIKLNRCKSDTYEQNLSFMNFSKETKPIEINFNKTINGLTVNPTKIDLKPNEEGIFKIRYTPKGKINHEDVFFKLNNSYYKIILQPESNANVVKVNKNKENNKTEKNDNIHRLYFYEDTLNFPKQKSHRLFCKRKHISKRDFYIFAQGDIKLEVIKDNNVKIDEMQKNMLPLVNGMNKLTIHLVGSFKDITNRIIKLKSSDDKLYEIKITNE